MNSICVTLRKCVASLLFILVSCVVRDSGEQLLQIYPNEQLDTMSPVSANSTDAGGGGIAAAVLVGLFLTCVMIVIVTVVLFMMLGCCGKRRSRESSPTPRATTERNTPQRHNSSLFKVLVNRRTNVKYGTSFSDNSRTNVQPTSSPVPHHPQPNHTESTRELMAHYEMMPDHDDADNGGNYQTTQPNQQQQHNVQSCVPGPNSDPRYSNVPPGASSATFDSNPTQQVQYDYIVHAGQRDQLDESLPPENTPEVRYEFNAQSPQDQGTSQPPPIPNRAGADLPGDGLVQHYAVSYATPTLTRTMEFADASKNIYREPARDTTSLYAQFKTLNINAISSKDLTITEVLGSGQFATVHKGTWKSEQGRVEVAVKTLKSGSDETAKVKFLQEAAIMGQFSHPNVVNLHGVTTREPMRIVLELLPKGDLRNVLISHRKILDGSVDANNQLCYKLLDYCRQISSAMCYLSSKAFIHRDLAARNILVAEDGACKVADFGMSRDLSETDYYISHGGHIPVKWTAPEALHFRKYTTASDVWSFGIVMYEIWSLGHKPFESLSNMEALKKVSNGTRLPPPSGCPRAIYSIMIKCWHPSNDDRPTFMEVVRHLSQANTTLLAWSVLEQSLYPEAMKLAGSIKGARKLHKDLQEAYL